MRQPGPRCLPRGHVLDEHPVRPPRRLDDIGGGGEGVAGEREGHQDVAAGGGLGGGLGAWKIQVLSRRLCF
jgi:hypothetical protein